MSSSPYSGEVSGFDSLATNDYFFVSCVGFLIIKKNHGLIYCPGVGPALFFKASVSQSYPEVRYGWLWVMGRSQPTSYNSAWP